MNWFQRLRRYIIIKTAENYYGRMALQCNELHKKTRKHHYIIIDPWWGKKVIITNRDNFRATKRAINDSGIRLAVNAPDEAIFSTATMPDVHNGCFYSSLLNTQLEKLMRHPEENAKAIKHLTNDIEARRRAYIKWTLENAKIRRPFGRLRERRIVRRELKAYKKKQKK